LITQGWHSRHKISCLILRNSLPYHEFIHITVFALFEPQKSRCNKIEAFHNAITVLRNVVFRHGWTCLVFEPFGLNVSSLLPRILKSAYSVVAIKLVALAPIAKFQLLISQKKRTGLIPFLL
jgi:hypothetical protein